MHWLQVVRRLSQPVGMTAEQAALHKKAVSREWGMFSLAPISTGEDCALEFAASKTKCRKSGAVLIAPVKARRGWWTMYGARKYPLLASAAKRLLAVHPTACASERNWSVWGQVYTKLRSRLGIDLAQDIVFIRGNRAGQVREDEELVTLRMLEEWDDKAEAAALQAAAEEAAAEEAVEEVE